MQMWDRTDSIVGQSVCDMTDFESLNCYKWDGMGEHMIYALRKQNPDQPFLLSSLVKVSWSCKYFIKPS